ncbi:MAG: B12-binding domain-containing protein [Candidatus Lokiarchaeia archaeon]
MSEEILERLKKAVIEFDAEAAEKWAKEAVEKGVDPIQAANALTEGIRQIGDGFGRGEYFLPDLVMAGEAMKRALPPLEEAIKKAGKTREALAKFVIGTVAGDIHDIGKTIVITLFQAAGFDVVDLGVDLPAEKFVEAVKEHKPDVLGLSALMTMTMFEQIKVIEALKATGIRDGVKVMVGGGAITPDFAQMIGADGYASNAPEAVEEAKKMLELE